MQNYGRKSTLISAYTALVTVALGVVAFDRAHPLNERILIADFANQTLPAQPVVIVWAPKPVGPAKAVAASPVMKTAAVAKTSQHVTTIAGYIAARPGM